MPIYALGERVPEIDPTAYVHPDATIIGSVRIGPEASIWPQAVLRADNGLISIGARSNVQDGSVLHVTPMWPTLVGEECVIGHLVHLESCTVEDRALVGNGAVVLHQAVISTGALVGSNAVVPNRMVVPPGAMALGVPAKIRENSVNPDEIAGGMRGYLRHRREYLEGLRRIG